MKIPIYQVDAFTDRLFGGNPAAICPLDQWPGKDLLQAIAAENNLSETAFFVPRGADYELTWFTPKAEVDLCGHATLASAHILFNHLGYGQESIQFHTASGILTVSKKGDLLEMDFPARKAVPVEPPQDLLAGLGLQPLEVLKEQDYMAVFCTEAEIVSISPDFTCLSRLNVLGVSITARGDGSDFVSRFFAPRLGIPEDPVTGSAHCTLVPYWADKLEKNNLHAFQLSPRKGELFCESRGERVLIAGKAVTYMTGELTVGKDL